MKAITRRLYTKPVILGMSLLLGTVVLVGLFVASKSRAATTYIPAGDDEFETTNNGETYHNFAASPIPENFFGPGSQKYTGVVPLEGEPLADGSDTDTIIHRENDVNVPGSTPLKMTGLSLKSINPIIVTYPGGVTEAWNVQVRLSDLKASTGTMTINAGGLFDSVLKVFMKFILTRVSDGTVLEIDTGAGGGPGFARSTTLQPADQIDEPVPFPEPLPVPCRIQAVPIDDVPVQQAKAGSASASTSVAVATGTCPPVTLTSNNSPWAICASGHFCIPRPITEQELLASHFASPPGTKKRRIR